MARPPLYIETSKKIDPLLIPAKITSDIEKLSKIASEIEDIRCVQFLKILLAAKLRYSKSASKLRHDVLKTSMLCKNYNSVFYCSEIEPVIHFAKDPLEMKEISFKGNIHNDFDERGGLRGTNVIWIPATNYNYPGIVKMPWVTQISAHILSFIPGAFRMIIKQQKSNPICLSHEKGRWIEWNDSFLHGGIPNTTNNTAVALVLRVSNRKSSLTPIKIIHNKSHLPEDKVIFNSYQDDLKKFHLRIEEIINELIGKENHPLDRKFINNWLSKSLKKLNIFSKKDKRKFYLYILDFWEIRKEIIFQNNM